MSFTIGLIREGKTPPDKRVPLTPKKCVEAQASFDDLRIVVQSSPVRSYSDQEYRDLGLEVREDISDCDVLMGVKEVPPRPTHRRQNLPHFFPYREEAARQPQPAARGAAAGNYPD